MTGPGRTADDAWRAALEHGAGCDDCRATGGCDTGRALLRAHREALARTLTVRAATGRLPRRVALCVAGDPNR